jgi:predicted ATP-grasp superfamily ATP-dependent carboligase
VLAEVGMHKLRKSPPFFGVCRVAEIADVPELRDPTLRILSRIGWWGMANAEYKLDPRDGRYRLMEINGRCFLMQGLALAAGVDYPGIAFQDVVHGERRPVAAHAWDGVWINAIDDLYHGLMFRQMEGLGPRDYWAPWRRRKVFAVLSRDDPAPFVAHVAFGVRKTVRMLLDRRYRASVVGRVQPAAGAAVRPGGDGQSP